MITFYYFRNTIDRKHYTILVGNHRIDEVEPYEEEYEIQEIFVNERYYPFNYDIALIRVKTPTRFSEHVIPACLPKADDLVEGSICAVTGWGDTYGELFDKHRAVFPLSPYSRVSHIKLTA